MSENWDSTKKTSHFAIFFFKEIAISHGWFDNFKSASKKYKKAQGKEDTI